jgi:hypothetical protein
MGMVAVLSLIRIGLAGLFMIFWAGAVLVLRGFSLELGRRMIIVLIVVAAAQTARRASVILSMIQ